MATILFMTGFSVHRYLNMDLGCLCNIYCPFLHKLTNVRWPNVPAIFCAPPFKLCNVYNISHLRNVMLSSDHTAVIILISSAIAGVAVVVNQKHRTILTPTHHLLTHAVCVLMCLCVIHSNSLLLTKHSKKSHLSVGHRILSPLPIFPAIVERHGHDVYYL